MSEFEEFTPNVPLEQSGASNSGSRSPVGADSIQPPITRPEVNNSLVHQNSFTALGAESGTRPNPAVLSAIARSTTGVGDAGAPVSIQHGEQTISGRRVVDSHGRDTVVTAEGRFHLNGSGQWAQADKDKEITNKPEIRQGQSLISNSAQTLVGAGAVLTDVALNISRTPAQTPAEVVNPITQNPPPVTPGQTRVEHSGSTGQGEVLSTGVNPFNSTAPRVIDHTGGAGQHTGQVLQGEHVTAGNEVHRVISGSGGGGGSHENGVLGGASGTIIYGTQGAELRQLIRNQSDSGGFQAHPGHDLGLSLGEAIGKRKELGLSDLMPGIQQVSRIPSESGQQPLPHPIDNIENRLRRALEEGGIHPGQLGGKPLPPLEQGQPPVIRPERPDNSAPPVIRPIDQVCPPPVQGGKPPEAPVPIRLTEGPPPVVVRPPDVPLPARLTDSPPPVSGRPPESPVPPVRPDRPQEPTTPVVRTDRPFDPSVLPVRGERPFDPSVLPPGMRPAPERLGPTVIGPDSMLPTSGRRDRMADQPPPPITGLERKSDGLPSPGDRRVDLAGLPPSSLSDRRFEAFNLKDALPQGALRDVLRDSVITGLPLLRDPNVAVSGQKIEFFKGLEQNLVLAGGKADLLKEGFTLASVQRVDGILRPGDIAGMNVTGKIDPLKAGDIQSLTGTQKLDGKLGDLTGTLKAEPGKNADGSTIAGGKNIDGIPGKPGAHTDIVGQPVGDGDPGKRPEATEKVDGEKSDSESDDVKPGAKKDDDDTAIVSDAPLIGGLALIPDKFGGKADKAEDVDDEDKNSKDRERRQKYIVKKGDTLELIAAKMLRDRKLAPLIYRINRAVIPSRIQNDRVVLDLRPKLVIFLPTSAEVKEFKSSPGSGAATEFEYVTNNLTPEEELQSRYGSNWDGKSGDVGVAGNTGEISSYTVTDPTGTTDPSPRGSEAAESVAHAESVEPTVIDRRVTDPTLIKEDDESTLLFNLSRAVERVGESQDSTERISYMVRLGDSLKSVAIRHPALGDASLWKLLAQVNNLQTNTDSRGVPAAKLVRGTTIEIPSQREIRQFRHRSRVQPVTPITVAQSAPKTVLDPTIIEGNQEAKSASKGQTRPVRTIRSEFEYIQRTMKAMENSISDLDERCRLVCHTDANECTELRLEFRDKDAWSPVIAYQIHRDRSFRHEFYPDGSKKTLRIDLPTTAVQELAENDISNNWRQYRASFVFKLGA